MVEKALVDGLLLVKEAETGDLTADVTDAGDSLELICPPRR